MVAATLRRRRRRRRGPSNNNPFAYRLPPEILATVASHLDEKSLVIATHVCLHWRSVLISSPRLWSHLSFGNEERGLEFLKRSKAAPVSVDLDLSVGKTLGWKARGELKENTNKFAALRAVRVPFLGDLLTQPFPILKDLEVITYALSFTRSLATANLGLLKNFHLQLDLPWTPTLRPRGILLDFLRGCPLLEVFFLSYSDRTTNIDESFATNGGSTEVVSLPCLRSFTQESRSQLADICLFNRLCLPSDCDIAFTIATDPSGRINDLWKAGFPTPIRDRSTGVEIVRVSCHDQNESSSKLKATFSNFNNTAKISFSIRTAPATYTLFVEEIERFLDFLADSEMARTVKLLIFENCPTASSARFIEIPGLTRSMLKLLGLKTLVLWQCGLVHLLDNSKYRSPGVWCEHVEKLVVCPPPAKNGREPTESEVLGWMRDIAVSRKHMIPLKAVVFYSQEEEKLPHGVIGELRGCVGSVEVIGPAVWRSEYNQHGRDAVRACSSSLFPHF